MHWHPVNITFFRCEQKLCQNGRISLDDKENVLNIFFFKKAIYFLAKRGLYCLNDLEVGSR